MKTGGEFLHGELSHQIIGAAMAVLNELKPGLEEHIAQMLGYLAITGLDLAILLNFRHAKLQVKRVARSDVSSSSAQSA